MRLLVCSTVMAMLASADTITFVDGSSVNAAVAYDKDKGLFKLRGRVQGNQPHDFNDVPAAFVKSVRFNTLDNNAESPPASPQPRGNVDLQCVVTPDQGTEDTWPLKAITIEDEQLIVSMGAGKSKKYLKENVKLLRIVPKPLSYSQGHQ